MEKISDIIIDNNNQFLVMNKPFGMPVQDDISGDSSLLKIAQNYCKHPVHILNRLDRPVSGIVVFSKKITAHQSFSKQEITKDYLAIVEGCPKEEKGKLIHYLKKSSKVKKAFCSDTDNGGKKSELTYEILHKYDRYTLLKIRLTTGRFHQIRAQMAHISCPIKGDVKYGARRKNPDRSIHLMAYQMQLMHPVNKDKMTFNAPIPEADSLWKIAKEKIADAKSK